MAQRSVWASYAPVYRAAEMRILANWIASGASGSVVGLAGCGRSNVLRYLCEHPTALQRYLPDMSQSVVLVSVDLYDLPSTNLVDLYREILHAFYWVREQFTPALAEVALELYRSHCATSDAFLAQKALYELLLAFQNAQVRVVLVMNRFDSFCATSTPQMVNTLRSLRDRFKETLCYIVGMRQIAIYLPEPALLGAMYELVDINICYIGALTPEDSRHMLAAVLQTAPVIPSETEIEAILELSGGFPSLVKAVGEWWKRTIPLPPLTEWLDLLLDDPAISHRVERMWDGLTQEEKQALVEIYKQSGASRSLSGRGRGSTGVVEARAGGNGRVEPGISSGVMADASVVLRRLAAKGCAIDDQNSWRVNGKLLAAYVARNVGNVRGRIWFDETARIIYQGGQVVDGLTPLEFDILRFLITHPLVRHTSDTIIDNAWPVDDNKHMITPNNLQVHISSIRKKIEPNPAEPRYLLTWHGRPGGYLFFTEGKPE